MKWSALWQRALLFGVTLLIAGAVVVVQSNRARTMAVVHNRDGTSKAVVGKSRLCGLMGIEVVLEYRSREGTVTYASVQDLLGSWSEVERRYANSGGGGLLVPLADEEPNVEK